jgi:hypothetical protein
MVVDSELILSVKKTRSTIRSEWSTYETRSAQLRPFTAVQVDFKQNHNIPQPAFERTIKNGYVLDPSILPENDTRRTLDIVLASAADDIRKNVNGKTFYIPANVHYPLPATEKQFIGL